MKRFMSVVIIFLLSVVSMAQTPKAGYVEVLYFHGKQRCMTCNAIEKHTKDVVTKDLAVLVKKGRLRFNVVDISKPEGENLADEYRVSWSSLYINKWKNGKEKRGDMTSFAFKNARNKTAVFKNVLKNKVTNMLK